MQQIVHPGQLVAERFRIERFIAEGGMGEVYEAHDQVLGERVALKFLNRRNMDNEKVLRRFRREILLARKVTHGNVCRLFDVYQHTLTGPVGTHDVTFVTMELLAGETLETALSRDGAMSEDAALPLVGQMAAALEAAHAADVIHRDFKSSNVMLVPRDDDQQDMRVVVTDFGLARSIGRGDSAATPLTGEMKIMGTPDYMAPEQLRGGEVSPRSDIYALGVVLFEMVTGAKPYDAENTMSLLVKRVSEPPQSPRRFAPDLSERWEEVILRCLASEPEDRYGRPVEVLAALQGRPLGTASTEGISAAASGDDRPHRMMRAVLLSAATVLAVLAALWWVGRGQDDTPRAVTFNPVQLTTDAGLELDPSFSPVGDAIVYSSDRSGTFELYVRDLAPGGLDTQITFDGTQAFEPTWSPDGTTIAYHAESPGGIWLVPAAGGPSRRLTAFGSRPSWSPDGVSIAFQSESLPALSDTAAPALSESRLFVIAVDGRGNAQSVTEHGRPAGSHAAPMFSPDGERLVFTTSQRGSSEIWSIGVDGQDLVPIETALRSADPVFAPGGDRIYFSASQRQVSGLWEVALSRRDGTPRAAPEQIANLGLASIRQIAISRDGTKVAYTGLVTSSNLWALPLDATTASAAGPLGALTTGSGRSNRPAFSAGGDQIAFDRWQLGVNIDVWSMRADGSGLRQLTTGTTSETMPSWLAGSETLVYLSLREDERALWTLDLASADEGRWHVLPADADWARLSPDGRYVAYHSRGDDTVFNVRLLEIESGTSRQLTFRDELTGFPVWSHDSRSLAFQAKRGDDSQVMVLDIDSGSEARQLTFGHGLNWPYSFSPDGDKVAFAGQRDGAWNIWWVSRSTGEERRLTDEGRLNAYVRYPAWSPSGEQLVFEQAETTGDIWLVERFLDE